MLLLLHGPGLHTWTPLKGANKAHGDALDAMHWILRCIAEEVATPFKTPRMSRTMVADIDSGWCALQFFFPLCY
jgi:hypothetical protein